MYLSEDCIVSGLRHLGNQNQSETAHHMSETSPAIALGTVYGDHSRVSNALSQFTSTELGHVPIPGLAGPNDLVQILGSVDGWKIICGTLLSIYGSGIVSEAGKDTWRTIAPRLRAAPAALQEKFLKLVKSLQEEREADQDVSIGLIEPTFDGLGRRDRVYLGDLSPEEVARHLYIFAHCARPVAEWLSEVYSSQTERGQVFVQMTISDEGTLVVTLVPGYGTHQLPPGVGIHKKVFDAQGKVIEEVRQDGAAK